MPQNKITLLIYISSSIMIVNPECLPLSVESRLLGLLTRKNPDYFMNKQMGYSVFKTPKQIRMYTRKRILSDVNLLTGEKVPTEHIALCIDRGMWQLVREFFKVTNKLADVADRPHIQLRIILKTVKVPIEIEDTDFDYEDYQQETIDKILTGNYPTGIISYPPGGGKTVIGMSLISILKQRTLVLVHTGDLMDQWLSRLESTYPNRTMGQMSSRRKHREGNEVTVSMLQTIVKLPNLTDFLRGYGMIIVDECHHVPAKSFVNALRHADSHYRFGLTASKKRRDHKEFLMHACFGNFISSLEYEDIETRIIYPKIMPIGITPNIQYDMLLTKPTSRNPDPRFKWTEAYGLLAEDPIRNMAILNVVEEWLNEEDTYILILVKRTSQARLLCEFIQQELFGDDNADKVGVLLGGGNSKYKKEKEVMLERMRNKEMRVIIGTSIADEGLDVVPLNRLILAAPSSFEETLKQRIGRVMRFIKGKGTPIVADIVDLNIPEFIEAWKSRERFYKKTNGIELDYSRLDLTNI